MTRENASAKASRYLAEGRVIVELVDPQRHVVRALVRGDGHLHHVKYDPLVAWSCTCPARSQTGCSHLLAVRRVVAVDLGRPR